MTNPYYTRQFNAQPNTLARSGAVRSDFSAIEAAFDNMATVLQQSLMVVQSSTRAVVPPGGIGGTVVLRYDLPAPPPWPSSMLLMAIDTTSPSNYFTGYISGAGPTETAAVIQVTRRNVAIPAAEYGPWVVIPWSQVGEDYLTNFNAHIGLGTYGQHRASTVIFIPNTGVVPASSQTVQAAISSLESMMQNNRPGFRNLIINGRMEIAQRGTTFNSAASGSYTLDRWRCDHSSAATINITQSTDAPSNGEFGNSLRVTVAAADSSIGATDRATISQRIEGFASRALIGRSMAISFWVRAPIAGTYSVRLSNSGTDRSYVFNYTVSSPDTWERKTVVISGGLITDGTWNWTNGTGLLVEWCLAAGTSFHTTAGAWQTGNFLCTSDQPNVLGTINNIFALTGVQIEQSTFATPFEHRWVEDELQLSQRYYEKSYALSTAPGTNTGMSGSIEDFGGQGGPRTAILGKVNFRVRKRSTSPSVAVWDAVGTASAVTAFAPTQNNAQGATVDNITDAGFKAYCAVANIERLSFHWAASDEL